MSDRMDPSGQPTTLTVVIPIFNEEPCIPQLMTRLLAFRDGLRETETTFLFVDDGSKDRSFEMLSEYAARHPRIHLIRLSRNYGHQIAITAGLDAADSDYVAIIDADLQDPPEAIADMLRKAREGFDVVYAQRITRKGESLLKLATARLFYGLLRTLGNIDIPANTGDFRLISRRVVNAFRTMRERHRFVRGMIPWVGFKSAPFLYHRDVRVAGETKYPMRKMVRLALDAIFSFSITPLRLATYFGLVILGLGILGGLFLLYLRLFTDHTVAGITAVLLTIIILGGTQILLLGIIGEYIGRIFEESKGRPLYFVADTVNSSRPEDGHAR